MICTSRWQLALIDKDAARAARFLVSSVGDGQDAISSGVSGWRVLDLVDRTCFQHGGQHPCFCCAACATAASRTLHDVQPVAGETRHGYRQAGSGGGRRCCWFGSSQAASTGLSLSRLSAFFGMARVHRHHLAWVAFSRFESARQSPSFCQESALVRPFIPRPHPLDPISCVIQAHTHANGGDCARALTHSHTYTCTQDGHAVRVFEMAHDVGGVWHYTDAVEQDPMGKSLDHRVHSSMYESLRTNLPREVMAYDDMEFTGEFDDRYAHMRASLQSQVITHNPIVISRATERNSGYIAFCSKNLWFFPQKT